MTTLFKTLAPLDPIANVIVSGSARGLFDPTASIKSEAKKKAAQTAAAIAPPPNVEEPSPIPEPQGKEAEAARRAAVARLKARRGRASTIFTDTSGEALGG